MGKKWDLAFFLPLSRCYGPGTAPGLKGNPFSWGKFHILPTQHSGHHILPTQHSGYNIKITTFLVPLLFKYSWLLVKSPKRLKSPFKSRAPSLLCTQLPVWDWLFFSGIFWGLPILLTSCFNWHTAYLPQQCKLIRVYLPLTREIFVWYISDGQFHV